MSRRDLESQRCSGRDSYALAFGLVLGLAILKFGNPVILDRKIAPPGNFYQAWNYAWPPHWAYWVLVPLVLIGAGIAVHLKSPWPTARRLWTLPLIWFLWQLVSAMQTVDGELTAAVLWSFGGCLACYFAGALIFGNRRAMRWLLIGVLAAFAFCLVRAAKQRVFEFAREHQELIEGERAGWTNFAPDALEELRRDGVVIATNGTDVANPAILARYAKGRVMGTLVYPNALAGAVLLLWPVSVAVAFKGTRRFKTATRTAVIVMTLFLGGACLFWTGSKLGWLVAMALAGMWLLRLDWPISWKYALFTFVTVAGFAVFAVRFQGYFSAGATSIGARFDYWRAAVRITVEHPVFGSGPGTFQKPYAALKAPDAEMARLVHNDYLEQFSDSGIIGGLSYVAWIVAALVLVGRRLWRDTDAVSFAVFVGLLGWFMQGLGEFSLYVPALAWTAFALLGWSVAVSGNPIDKTLVAG